MDNPNDHAMEVDNENIIDYWTQSTFPGTQFRIKFIYSEDSELYDKGSFIFW